VDRGPGVAAGVADDVGERLLHDAQRRQVDPGGHRPGLALDGEVDIEAGRPGPSHQAVQVAQAGRGDLGSPRPGLAVRPVLADATAQHAQHRVQLRERLLARLVDGLKGGAGLLGPLVQQVQRHPRLHVDERDVVGQHVVQLPGDEQALLARATKGLFPRHMGPLGTPLEADTRDLAGGADQRQPDEVRRRAGEAAGLLHLVG
jgi:hypothetical protein